MPPESYVIKKKDLGFFGLSQTGILIGFLGNN